MAIRPTILIGEAIEKFAIAKGIGRGPAKMAVLAACEQGFITAWWPHYLGSRQVPRQEFSGADVEVENNTLLLANGEQRRKGGVYLDQAEFDDWLKESAPLSQGTSAEVEPPRKRGAKERIQWDRIKTEMTRLMDHHGDFDPADPEWNAQARLEEALKQYCQQQFSEAPSDGALRQKLPDWLGEWRSKKSKGFLTSS
jgi:hypothetical protein